MVRVSHRRDITITLVMLAVAIALIGNGNFTLAATQSSQTTTGRRNRLWLLWLVGRELRPEFSLGQGQSLS